MKLWNPSDDSEKNLSGCSGVGLVNIQKRLRLTYGNNYGITIQKNNKGGTHILIQIPKRSDL